MSDALKKKRLDAAERALVFASGFHSALAVLVSNKTSLQAWEDAERRNAVECGLTIAAFEGESGYQGTVWGE